MKDDPTSVRRKLRELENIRELAKTLVDRMLLDDYRVNSYELREFDDLEEALNAYNPSPKGRDDE